MLNFSLNRPFRFDQIYPNRVFLVQNKKWTAPSNSAYSNSSVIRQKGESPNGHFKKTKYVQFSKNEHFLPPNKHTNVCISGGKKCSFFGKFDMLCFLENPFWDSSYCCITDKLLLNQMLVQTKFAQNG